MEITSIARQALLYGHIIAFALALATILKEDVRLLRAKRIDSASLLAAAKLVKWLLLALWVTGVPMVMMDIGIDISLLLGKPKLLAKLIVVGVLTLNGILLHFIAFPMITGRAQNPNKAAAIATMLGAVSTASWLYASFVGAGRFVGTYFSLYDFVILYVLALFIAVSVAILFVRDRLKLLLLNSSFDLNIAAGQDHSLSAALLEADAAWLALAEIQALIQHLEQQPLSKESCWPDRPEIDYQKFAAEITRPKTATPRKSANSRRDLVAYGSKFRTVSSSPTPIKRGISGAPE
jgi:hypothetical protein